MRPAEHHTRIVSGLFIIVSLIRIDGFCHPFAFITRPQSDQRHSREIETETAHWLALLKSSDVEERREAAMRLSRVDGDDVRTALVAALADSSPRIRAVVAAGLGERQDPSVVPLLAARLSSDKDVFVRKTAAYALGGFSGADRTAALIAALKDKEPGVRGAAAVSLGDHPDASAIAALSNALSDKSAFVRAQTARSLGVNARAAAHVVPALIALLTSDDDSEVKRQAAAALGLIGDRSALPALERARHDNDSYLVQTARDSIRKIEGK